MSPALWLLAPVSRSVYRRVGRVAGHAGCYYARFTAYCRGCGASAGQRITVQGCLKPLKTSVCAHGFTTVKAYHRQWLRLIIDNCLSTLWNIKSFKPVIKWRIIGLLSPSKNIYVHFFKNPRKMTPFTVTLKNQDTCSLMR